MGARDVGGGGGLERISNRSADPGYSGSKYIVARKGWVLVVVVPGDRNDL